MNSRLSKVLLLLIVVNYIACMSDEEKAGYVIFRFNELGHEPLLKLFPGDKFMIEIEEEPGTRIHWKLRHNDHINYLETGDFIKPINLDEDHSGEYYTKEVSGKVVGVYAFKFLIDTHEKTEGTESLLFQQINLDTKAIVDNNNIYVQVLKAPEGYTPPLRDDL